MPMLMLITRIRLSKGFRRWGLENDTSLSH
jgi:hypothetical protein